MAKLNPFTFQTEYWDQETDKYYWKHRYYDPNAGRWLSRDPIGEKGGLNLYAFVGNDAVNCFDKLGLEPGRTSPDPDHSGSGITCKKSLDFDLTSPSEHTSIFDKVFLQPWGVQYVDNSKQILDAINKAVPKYDPDGICCKGSCIQSLTLSAHGEGPGVIPLSNSDPNSTEKEMLNVASAGNANSTSPLAPTKQRLRDQFESAKQVFSSVKSKMCRNGKISFVVCNAGKGEAGQALRNELNQIFGPDISITIYEGNAGYMLGSPSTAP